MESTAANVYEFQKAEESFGETLKEARKKENLTQGALADLVFDDGKISHPTAINYISKFERDLEYPTVKELQRLNEIFDCEFQTKTKERKYEPRVKVNVKAKEESSDISTSRIDKVFLKNMKDYCTSYDRDKLCKLCNVVPGYFDRQQYDMTPITLEMAYKVSKALKVSLDELLRDKEKEQIEAQIEALQERLKKL